MFKYALLTLLLCGSVKKERIQKLGGRVELIYELSSRLLMLHIQQGYN